jgi:TIGR03009 family protein
MPCLLKPVLAGLAVSSLCLAFAVDVAAQITKKGAPIKPVQADDSASRTRPSADDENGDEDAGEAAAPAPRNGGKQPRPKGEPLRIEKLTPELEKILKDWEFQTSKFKTMAGGFTRFRYDKTFEVEKRAEGKFVYEAPDKGNYELWGAKLQKGAVARKKNKNGQPFALKPDEPERWICNGKKVIKINDKEKTYEEVQIPPESQGQNIIDGPLPFIWGMKAEKAKLRYKLKLLEHKDPEEIWLEVKPRNPGDSANWVKAKVIIEAKTFKPKAVFLEDPTGAESVHVFKDIVINEKRGFFDRDPFKPNLRGFKLVVTGKGADDPVEEKPIAPPTKPAKATKAKPRAAANDGSELDLGRTADSGSDGTPRKSGAAAR